MWLNDVKEKWKKEIEIWKLNGRNIWSTILIIAGLFVMISVISDKETDRLREENKALREQVVSDEYKAKTMFFILVREGERIDYYKARLRDCEQNKAWTPEKETK
jgi:hypothetical protein